MCTQTCYYFIYMQNNPFDIVPKSSGNTIPESERIAVSQPIPQNVEIEELTLVELRLKYPERYKNYISFSNENPSNALFNNTKCGVKKWLCILKSLDEYINVYEKEISTDLRHVTQQKVFSEIRRFIENGETKGYVKLPTGSGKTVIFQKFVEAIKQRTIIVVPTTQLIQQTRDRFKKSKILSSIGVIDQTSKDIDSQYIITTYNSLIIQIKNKNILPDDFPIIILDEAHKAQGNVSKDVIGQFNKSIVLGFTATPDYSENKKTQFAKKLSDVLPNKIYEMNVSEAIQSNMLCDAVTLPHFTGLNISSVEIKDGDYVDSSLSSVLDQNVHRAEVVDYYEKNFSSFKTIVFCAGIDHAEHMAKQFTDKKISAACISSRTSKLERKKILTDFKKGKIQILCNANILIEGFDDEEVSLCLNINPTMSAVVAEQRGGRVLRLDPKNPNKKGYIIDFVYNDTRAVDLKVTHPIFYFEVLKSKSVSRTTTEQELKKNKKRSTDKYQLIPSEKIQNQEIHDDVAMMEILKTKITYQEIGLELKNKLELQNKQRLEQIEKQKKELKNYENVRMWFDQINVIEKPKKDLILKLLKLIKTPINQITHQINSDSKLSLDGKNIIARLEQITQECNALLTIIDSTFLKLRSRAYDTVDPDILLSNEDMLHILNSLPADLFIIDIENITNKYENIIQDIADFKDILFIRKRVLKNLPDSKTPNGIRKILNKMKIQATTDEIIKHINILIKSGIFLDSESYEDPSGVITNYYSQKSVDEIIKSFTQY